MKQILFLFSLFFIFAKSTAQPAFYGMTNSGGQYGVGTIFKTDGSGANQTVQYNFSKIEGNYPLFGNLLQASDGKLYGMTNKGGAYNLGVLFTYDPVSEIITKKIDFDGPINGSMPTGSLIQASDGNLYGMTGNGGANGFGVIFAYNPSTNTITKKFDFVAANGGSPSGSLIQANNGLLYGLTENGGANNSGVLFSFDLNTNTYAIEFSFLNNTTGVFPRGSLMQASDGNLYGTTSNGGANIMGVIFQYNPATHVYTKKFDFSPINGKYPTCTLIQASNGNLYGMTSAGGTSNGVIFSFDPTTSAFVKKYNFTNSSTTNSPFGTLVQASDGNLYGINIYDGANNKGILFAFDTNTDTYTKKIDFAGINGNTAQIAGSTLMQASDGNLYGMTPYGGISGIGNVFQYNINTSNITNKISFEYSIDGSKPTGSLLQASDGNLYGMTTKGGVKDSAILFQFDPITNIYTKKIDFLGANNGGKPNGSLVQASDGNLYGMTVNGGANNKGVLFSYNPITNIFTKKLDFAGAANGANPYGSLVQASDGNLYGMTASGGLNNMGVLFTYNPTTDVYTVKLNFAGTTNGSTPYSTLIQASDGNLYGMTVSGGANNNGVLFKYNPITNIYSKKMDFAGSTNGSGPQGSLLQSSNGILYGMTTFGGVNNKGVLFSYNLTTSVYTKRLDFADTTKGANPFGSLIEASNGNLYGITAGGGINNKGVLFSYNSTTNTFTKINDFTSLSGSQAQGSLIEINPCYSPTVTVSSQTNVSCSGGTDGAVTITATGNSPFIYTWSSAAGNSATASGLSAGMYTCVVTNSCGATRSQTVMVTQPSSLTLSVVVSNINGCSGSTNTLTANAAGGVAPITYTWTAGSTNNVNIINPVVATVYTVNITDANNCNLSHTVAVNVSSLPTLTVTGTNTVCLGTSTGFIANGAMTYVWNTAQTTSSISVNPSATTIYTVWGTDMNGCSNTETVNVIVNNTCADVWPGDANSDGTADNLDVLELGLHYTQTGAPRVATSNNWQSYFANNWTGTITNGKNLNHSDCNGDGVINDDDTLAIYNNYGLTHTFKPAQTNTVNPQLSIVPDQAIVTKGNWGTASVYLGDAATSINNINGVAFTVDFDNTLIEPNSIYIEYQNSFIDAGQNLHFQKPDFVNSKLFTASTHTVSNNVSGYGKIATLYYQIKSSLATDEVLNIGLSQANQSDASGAIGSLTSGTGTLIAIGASVGLKENSFSGNVSITPNPTNGLLTISFNTIPQNTKVELYNSIGALVLTEQMTSKNNTVNISELSSGMYFIKVIDDNKVVAVKKVVRE